MTNVFSQFLSSNQNWYLDNTLDFKEKGGISMSQRILNESKVHFGNLRNGITYSQTSVKRTLNFTGTSLNKRCLTVINYFDQLLIETIHLSTPIMFAFFCHTVQYSSIPKCHSKLYITSTQIIGY